MRSDPNIYNTYVIKSILANNEFGIKEISDLEDVVSRYFIRNEYSKIAASIRNGELDTIRSLPENKPELREYLYILSFNDQMNKKYIVTVYDSDELWQNPQVIEIFPVIRSQ